MKNYIYIIFSILFLACEGKKEYTILGVWEGGDGESIYLRTDDGARSIDSAVVEKGKFLLTKPIEDTGKYILDIPYCFAEVMLCGQPVEVRVESGASGRFVSVKNPSQEQNILEQSIVLQRESINVMGKTGEEQKRHIEKLDNFILTHLDKMAAIYMINWLIPMQYPLDKVEGYYDHMRPELRTSRIGQAIKTTLDEIKSTSIGSVAPEIELQTPEGESVKLSSLRGHYVLLDFWASWCGPCCAEMPTLKTVYDKYKENGLKIYSVSLDNSREAWVNKINELGLNWINVSSLKGSTCPAVQAYRIVGIPRIYLLDPDGRIIAIDVRGEELKAKVASLFN